MIPRQDDHRLVVFACDLVLNTPDDDRAPQGGGIFAALDLLADPDRPHEDMDRKMMLIFVNWLHAELGDDAVRQVRAKHRALAHV